MLWTDAEVKTPKRIGWRLSACFAGLDATALSVETNPLACAANCKVKSLAGGRRSSVKEWEWNAFFSFQHLDSSRLRYAQAQGLKIGERELVFNKSNKRKT